MKLRKVNYMASAGTGKTRQLVEEVYNNYILKNVSIENLFISTFTEKSAGEIKNRIINKLKSELFKTQDKEKIELLFNNIYKIQESYIGTIHSLCLKIIKNYPEQTFITNDSKILEQYLLDTYLYKAFEKYIKENYESVKKIANLIQNKNDLYKIFKEFYHRRVRIKDININNIENEIDKEEKCISELKNDSKQLLTYFIDIYYKELIDLRDKNLFNTDLEQLRRYIEYNKLISLKIDCGKEFPRFVKKTKISEEAKEIIKNLDKKIAIEENKLIEKIEELKKRALSLSYITGLKEFYKFNMIMDNLKKEEEFIDYEDIIIKCINLLKNNTEIRQKLQDKFKAIIIDEFQDTDNSQIELVNLLSEKSDLIVLGDPKQCIYEWRNANLDDYLSFLEKNNFENINLNTCHRSNKTLVSFYNNLFSCKNHNFLNNLNEIYTSELEYNIKDEKISNSINFILTNNEALSILEKIKELNQEDYKYGDIMILFRKNKKAKELINLLKNNSIPFISYLDSSLKSNLEVITVLNLLKLIKYPFDKLNLISVLKSPIFCFSDLDIFNIKDKLDIYQIENFECIRSLINDLNKYSIYDILKTLYKEFKIVETFSLYPDSMQKIENLNKLLKIASNFDRNNFQFRDFINFLDENEQEQTENLLIEDTNFIKIMTIHKSKGLESKIVIIPYLLDIDDIEDEGFYNIDNIEDEGFYNIDNLMVKIKNNNKVIAQSSNFDEKRVKNKIKNAEKRLLYVAFTRAKEKLILLASEYKSSKNKNKSSKNTSSSNELKREIFDLVKTIESYNETNFKEDNLQNTEYKNYWNSLKNNKQLELSKLQEFQNIDKKRINDYEESIMNKKFSSVSQLMQIEKIDDYESFILDNDENLYKNNYSSELGTFVHKVLENFNFPKDISFAENEILSIIDYQKKTIVNENILNEAKEILLNFLNSKYYNEISNSKILFKELPFTLKENDVYIEGIIDLVYENNNKIIIMDYKTNKIHDKEKLEKNYYLQKKYYTEAIKVIFPERSNDEIEFKFCWLREVI